MYGFNFKIKIYNLKAVIIATLKKKLFFSFFCSQKYRDPRYGQTRGAFTHGSDVATQ